MILQAVEVDAAADVTTEKLFPIPTATPEIGIPTNRERRSPSKFQNYATCYWNKRT